MKLSNLAIQIKKRQVSRDRAGLFTVEFAIVASIFFMTLLSSFEFSRLYFARHALDQAAYGAAREGIVQGATVSQVESKARAILGAAGVTPKTVSVSPTKFDELTTTVTVAITCDVSRNSWIPARFFLDPNISAHATLDHENQSYLLKADVNGQVGNNNNEPIDK